MKKCIRIIFSEADGGEVIDLFLKEYHPDGWYDICCKYGVYAGGMYSFKGELYKWNFEVEELTLYFGEGKHEAAVMKLIAADLDEERYGRLANAPIDDDDGYRRHR